MSSKTIRLATLVTIAYWLGSIAGCSMSGDNQNFKILDDDTPLFQTAPDAGDPGAARVPASGDRASGGQTSGGETDRVVAAFEPDTDLAVPDSVPEAEAPVGEADAPAAAEADTTVATETTVETEPSLNGLDRSHWARMSTGADSDQTPVQPHYFQDWPPAALRGAEAEAQPPDNTVAAGWDRANSLSTVAQPFKFAMDLVLLPVHVYQHPPRNLQVRSPFDQLARLRLFRTSSADAPADQPGPPVSP